MASQALSPNECRKLAELAEANCMADFCRTAPANFTEAHGLYVEQTHSYAETRRETKDAPNPSYHNLQHLGFQLAYLRLHYRFDPALSGETHPG